MASRGDIIFDSSFECGNLAGATRLSKFEWELKVRPDTHNHKHRLWFYFKVRNVEKNQLVLFTIPNMSKGRSLYREGLTPLIKSHKRPTWQRLPTTSVIHYRIPKSKAYSVSFFFQFDDPKDCYSFAYSYPYSYTDLQQYLHGIDSMRYKYYSRQLLCRSLQQRRVDLLTITNPVYSFSSSSSSSSSASSSSIRTSTSPLSTETFQNEKSLFLKQQNIAHSFHSSNQTNLKRKQIKKHTIVLSARIHPGESPAQFIMQGLIDFLISSDMRAKILRDFIVFKIIPMLNPDGVYLGNYRCNSLGYDMNRYWGNPHPLLHPEVKAARDLLLACPRVTSSSSPSLSLTTASTVSQKIVLKSSDIPKHESQQTVIEEEIKKSSDGKTPLTQKVGFDTYHSDSNGFESKTTATCEFLPDLDFFIDIHSHSTALNAFTYGNSVERLKPNTSSSSIKTTTSSMNENSGMKRNRRNSLTNQNGVPSSPSSMPNNPGSGRGGGGGYFDGLQPHPYSPLNPNRCNLPNSVPDELLDMKKSVMIWEHESKFPKLLSERCSGFSFLESRFDSDPTKAGTGRRAIGEFVGYPVKCYTLEASFFASTSAHKTLSPFTPERYMEIGRDLALSFLDYYEEELT